MTMMPSFVPGYLAMRLRTGNLPSTVSALKLGAGPTFGASSAGAGPPAGALGAGATADVGVAVLGVPVFPWLHPSRASSAHTTIILFPAARARIMTWPASPAGPYVVWDAQGRRWRSRKRRGPPWVP